MRNAMPLSLSPQSICHLGNIRQVTQDYNGISNGKVIQTMNYYPFGAEFCDNSTKSYVQNHKYNGKEFDNMHGLNTYDYGARQYNPVTARWDRMDPLSEKYYSTSPYAYCANNPVRFIDPDGMEIDTSNMNEEEKRKYQALINEMCKFEMFATLYKELANSENVIKISLGNPRSNGNGNEIYGQFTIADNYKGGDLVLQKDALMNELIPHDAVTEEFFHAYQNNNRNLYTGEFNREFEAKTFVCSTYGIPIPFPAMDTWLMDLIAFNKYGDESTARFLTPSSVCSDSFLKDYRKNANQYGEYNRKHNYGNSNYKTMTNCAPASLIRIVNKTYNH